ncbi:MAG TPA: UvrD-helicase domain-containing protein [Pyrinomonadaceae bacterium]|nr:UvrD-helicase domain-containing protein [Pyrinomonadaceae bacterium]
MKPKPQVTIAHYQIIEPIGAGGMGAVYKAFDNKLQRIVALKVLPLEYVSQQDRRRRFFQEARAASALTHPHILTVYEVGEDDGKPYIAMEYIEGQTIRQKIKTKAMPLNEALEVAIQIADGLAKAHEIGIIHRDLKPENLMLSKDGYAKILDFGLAKLVAQRDRALVAADSEQKTLIRGVETESGTLLGTVNYMAPEQLLGQRVDHRADIFSFAVVVSEMLTGSAPFVHDNRIDTMHAILHREPKLAESFAIPVGLRQILFRSLAKTPKDRYQTINELAQELRAIKKDLDLGKSSIVANKSRLVLRRDLSAATGKIDYAADLNEAQYKAVMTTEGPLLIVAGAGTGKTRTLVYRVARLVEIGVKPESVLLLTFTRRAATSMLTRAAALADARCQRVSGGTFHALGHSVLRTFAEEAGVQKTFTVLDQSDTEDLIDLLRRQIKLTKERRFPRKRTIAAIFSMMVNKMISMKQVLNQAYPEFIDERPNLEELFKSFEGFKRSRQMLTYDDLLVRLREGLEASPTMRDKLSQQYRYIMVDEYQDTNRLQAELVKLMTSQHDNVAVVGDEFQSIYSFRGASHRNMLEFPKLFPKAQVIKLEENYRSTQPILDVANALMGEVKESYKKRLFSRIEGGQTPVVVSAQDENEQSRFVAQRIEELRNDGVPFSEIAVLFRSSSHSFDLEIELGKQGIPFRKFGGIRFAESAHIKDALSFLRVVVKPSDTLSWFRSLKLIEHVGDATVYQILEHLGVEKKEFRSTRTRQGLFKKLHTFPGRASYKSQLTRLARLFNTVLESKTPNEQLSAVLRFYRPLMKNKFDDSQRRGRDLEHLQAIAKRYKTIAKLLDDVALDPTEAIQGSIVRRGGGFVTLSTVHSAKGLEWDNLFVIWMTDGWFPSNRFQDEFDDLDEERRLLYVATTRARRDLHFVYPLNVFRGDAYRGDGGFSPVVSRFLEPIPPEILPHASLMGD